VITLVPILNFAAAGYSLEVTRRVINNEPRCCLKWDDIGGKLVKAFWSPSLDSCMGCRTFC